MNETMTEKDFKDLWVKMACDKEFLAAAKTAKNEHDLYDIYKKYNYTNVEFDEFMKILGSRVENVYKTYSDPKKLTEEELEQVVGGFNIFRFFMGLIDAVPVFGPIVATAMKGVADAVQGNWADFAKDTIIGAIEIGGGAIAGKLASETLQVILDVGLGAAGVTGGITEGITDNRTFG